VFEQVFETCLEIWARNTRTGRDQMVLRADGLRVASPAMSPDGRRIAYNTGELAGSGTSCVIEVDGGVPRLGPPLRAHREHRQRLAAHAAGKLTALHQETPDGGPANPGLN